MLLVGAKCDLETASADTAELDRFCADHVRRAASESTQNRHRDHPAPSLMETSRVDAAREPENRGNTRNRRYAGFYGWFYVSAKTGFNGRAPAV